MVTFGELHKEEYDRMTSELGGYGGPSDGSTSYSSDLDEGDPELSGPEAVKKRKRLREKEWKERMRYPTTRSGRIAWSLCRMLDREMKGPPIPQQRRPMGD